MRVSSRLCSALHASLRRSAKAPPVRRPLASARAAAAESLYNHPRLYDVAFGLRDFEAETEFLLRAAQAHAGAPPASFLELACGPGRHTRLAAQRGLRAVGLDLSHAMLAYARAEAEAEAKEEEGGAPRDVSVLFAQGDMSGPHKAPEVASAAPFDVVACLLGSLSHLSGEEVGSCFAGVQSLLSPAGVFVLELAHPRLLFDGSTVRAARRSEGGGVRKVGEGWEVPCWDARAPGLRLRVQWGAPSDAFDPLTQVLQRTVSVEVQEVPEELEERPLAQAGCPGQPRTLRSVVSTRLFTRPELELLARAAGLRVVAAHGDLDQAVQASDPQAERLVLVFAHA